MQAEQKLPIAFAELEPFTSHWLLYSERARMDARETGSIDELRSFYEAMMARWPDIVEYLGNKPADGLDAQSSALLELALSLVEVAIAVELYGKPQFEMVFDRERFEF